MSLTRGQERENIVRPWRYLIFRTMLYGIVGFASWLGLSQFLAIDQIEWCLVATGFSGWYLGFFGGILKLYKTG